MTTIALAAGAGAALVIARKKVEQDHRLKWGNSVRGTRSFPFDLGSQADCNLFPGNLATYEWLPNDDPISKVLPHNQLDESESECSPLSDLSSEITQLPSRWPSEAPLLEEMNDRAEPIKMAIGMSLYDPGSLICSMKEHIGHVLSLLDDDGAPIRQYLSMEMHSVEQTKFSMDKFYRLLKSTDHRVRKRSPGVSDKITKQSWVSGPVILRDDGDNQTPRRAKLHLGRSFAVIGWSTVEVQDGNQTEVRVPCSEGDAPSNEEATAVATVNSGRTLTAFGSYIKQTKIEPPRVLLNHATTGIWSALSEVTGHGVDIVHGHITEPRHDGNDSMEQPSVPATLVNCLSMISFRNHHEDGISYLCATGSRVVLLPIKHKIDQTQNIPSTSLIYPVAWGLAPNPMRDSYDTPKMGECYLRLCLGRHDYVSVPMDAEDFIWMSKHPEGVPRRGMRDLASPIKELSYVQKRHLWRNFELVEDEMTDGTLVRTSLRFPLNVDVDDITRLVIDLSIKVVGAPVMQASYPMMRVGSVETQSDSINNMKRLMTQESFDQWMGKGNIAETSYTKFMSRHMQRFLDRIISCHKQLDSLPKRKEKPWSMIATNDYEVILSRHMLDLLSGHHHRLRKSGYSVIPRGRLLAGVISSASIRPLYSCEGSLAFSMQMLVWRDQQLSKDDDDEDFETMIDYNESPVVADNLTPEFIRVNSHDTEMHQLAFSSAVWIPKNGPRAILQMITGAGPTTTKMISILRSDAQFKFDQSFLPLVPQTYFVNHKKESVRPGSSSPGIGTVSDYFYLPLVLIDPLQQVQEIDDPALAKEITGYFYSVKDRFKKIIHDSSTSDEVTKQMEESTDPP